MCPRKGIGFGVIIGMFGDTSRLYVTKRNYFSLRKQNHIAIITFDAPDQKLNFLSTRAVAELNVLVHQTIRESGIHGVVIISGKDNFVAGADLLELGSFNTAAEATSAVVLVQAIFQTIAESKKPYVAAIHGACLGGGLELALACHARVSTVDKKTVFAFPEVLLGIMPAAGGTQRLPRLLGLKTALSLLLSGKKIGAKKAFHMGLVDATVERRENLLESSISLLNLFIEGKKRAKSRILWPWSLLLLMLQRFKIKEKTNGLNLSKKAILDSIKAGILGGTKAGYKQEAVQFGLLQQTPTSKNLMRLFFAQKSRQKSSNAGFDVEHVGVMGSGFMGTGIAYVSLQKNLQVYLSDSRRHALARALSIIEKSFDARVLNKSLPAFVRDRLLGKLTTGFEIAQFGRADIVIEAITEDLLLKQDLLKKLESHVSPQSIFATNTSSIPIKDIAQNSAIKDRIIGMHFFSPVDKMPLLEIVKSKNTTEETLKKALQLGQKLSKTIIVVNDSAGFYTTRIMSALLDEAIILLTERFRPREIDRCLERLGFFMGPLALMDQIGLDVLANVQRTLHRYFGNRLIANVAFYDQIIKANMLGKKTAKGFYKYQDHEKIENGDFYKLIRPFLKKKIKNKISIGDRMFLRMVNEAAFCLSEQVIQNVEDGDVGAVFGVGFPAHLGGPFQYIADVGDKNIAEKLAQFHEQLGDRFKKAPCF